MNNRDVEEKLRRASSKITPDVMDKVMKRIEKGDDPVIPMDMHAKRHRRSAWIPVLASAAALLLVTNVGMFAYYHRGAKDEVVELTPHSPVSEGGALLIERIVEIDPEYTPEQLSSFSISELDTILNFASLKISSSQAENTRVDQPAEEEPMQAQQSVDEESPEQPAENRFTDGLIAESEGTVDSDPETVETVSDNQVIVASVVDDPQQPVLSEDVAISVVLNEDEAYAAVLKDAGTGKESVHSHSISITSHAAYGTVYSIDFETDEYIFRYRITESGKFLARGMEFKETETQEQ